MKRNLVKTLVVATFFATVNAQATTLTFDLNHNFGTVDAGGNVIVNINEASTAGDVHIEVSNWTLGFVNELYFNYSPNADIASATIANFVATSGIVANPSVQYNAGQGFAILFDFVNTPGSNFTNGESVAFDLSANADLTVSGFNTLGGGPVGDDYYMAAHINSVSAHGSCESGSAKIGDSNGANVSGGELNYRCNDDPPSKVPEPATALLMGLGLASLQYRSRRKA